MLAASTVRHFAIVGAVNGFVGKSRIALLLVATVLLLGLFSRLLDWLKAGEHPTPTPVAGSLLVARPGSVDRNFAETVVLLVWVDAEHTVGLVLNRSRSPQGEALPEGVARWGGPVSPEHLTSLVHAEGTPEGARRVLEGVLWRQGLSPGPEGTVLTFSGLAAWGPGQLAQEIDAGGWWVMEGSAEVVFSAPESLWAACIARRL